MAEYVNKKTELYRYWPKPAYNLTPGKGLTLILDIFGDQLDVLAVDVGNARDQFLLDTAEGYYLAELGKDLDVFKPKNFRMQDQVYRQLIEIITNSSKNIEYIFERLLKLFFGNNVFVNNLAKVYSYQKNLINIDIKKDALVVASSRDLYGTSYLHRNQAGHFDGWGTYSWTASLPALLPAGSLSITLPTLPTGIPEEGFVEIGTYGASDYETKHFTLVGNSLNFIGPTYYDHPSASALRGPETPDDYPSDYLFDNAVTSVLGASYGIGATSLSLGAGYEDLPTEGTCYLGAVDASAFESIGFTRAANVLTLYGATVNSHVAGEGVVVPCFYRHFRALSQTSIAKGASLSILTVDNCADFPSLPFEGAVVFNRSFDNEEIVPFKGRIVGDNTQMLISSAYKFAFDHAVGEPVHLMALKSSVDRTGIDFAFYLNDTEGLRQQLFALLTRVKVVGCKIVFTVY